MSRIFPDFDLSLSLLLWSALLLPVGGCELLKDEPSPPSRSEGRESISDAPPLLTPSLRTSKGDRRARFPLPSPPQETYQTGDLPLPKHDFLAEIISDQAPELTLSNCLVRAAQSYASYHPHEPTIQPPRAFLSFVLHHAGCPDSTATVHLFYTSEGNPKGFAEYLKNLLPSQSEALTHIGAARARGKDPYRWTWAVLISKRSFTLEAPLSKSAPIGSKHLFSFSLDESLHDPKVLSMTLGGEITNIDVKEEGDHYESTLEFGPERGEQWIEILAKGPLGPEVVALFPIHAGTPLSTEWEGPLPPNEEQIQTSKAAEQLMFKLISRDRSAHGLPALVWDPKLASVARGHSKNMRNEGFFAHTSPSRGDLSNRLRRAAYKARLSSENIARNGSIHDAEVGLMESLGHRANLLSPDVTHVGVGVEMSVSENGHRVLHITQNFAHPIQNTSPSQLRQQLSREINQERTRRGLSPLDRPSILDGVAAVAAAQIQARGFQGDEVNNAVKKELERAGVRYRSFHIHYQTLHDISDISPPESAKGSKLKSMGVGVARAHEHREMHGVVVLMLE